MKIVSQSKDMCFVVMIIFFTLAVGKQNVELYYYSKVSTSCGDTVVMQFSINFEDEVISLSWFHEEENIVVHDATDYNLITEVGKYTSTVQSIDVNKRYIMLNITSSTYNDAGIYTCEVYFQRGLPVLKSWSLQVQGKPEIEMFGESFMERQLLTSRCCFYLGMWPDSVSVEWFLDGKLINEETAILNFKSSDKTTACSSYTTVLDRRYHLKLLTCLIRNNLNFSASSELKVLYSAKVAIMVFKNKVKQPSLKIFVEENDNISIHCTSDANPRPKVKIESKLSEGQWKRLPIKQNRKIRKGSQVYATFNIYNFKRNHSQGSYRCTAFNDIDPVGISGEKYLLFEMPPKVFLSYDNVTLTNASYNKDHGYEIHYGQNNTYVAANKTVNVTCLVEGAKPQADITWMINGEIVDDVPPTKTERNLHENKTFDSMSTLEFKPTGVEVTVTCNVSLNGTDIGTTANATFLTYVLPNVFLLHNGIKLLIDEVYVEKNKTVNITCYAEGSRPPANLSWEDIYDHLATFPQEKQNVKNSTFDTLTSLIISPKKDVETISCKSSVLEIDEIITFDLTIRTYVLGKPSITFNGESLDIIYINRNDTVTLVCSDGDSIPIPTLSWKINRTVPKSEVFQSIGSSNLVFQPKHNDFVECFSYLNGPNITIASNVSFHCENHTDNPYSSNIILTVVVPCAAAVILTVLVVICVYIAAKRLKGSQSTSISADLDIPMEETSNVTSSKPLQKEYVVAGTDKSFPKPPDLELPKIPGGSEVPYYSELPEQENAYELNFHTEYYSAMGKSGARGKMFSGKDICFILNMKMGHIYDRWMGTIDVNQVEKCVILSTVSEKLRKKEIHWHKFVKQALEIPEATSLTNFEGIGIYEGKLYLIQEHMDCEKLDVRISVPFSRPEVMEHLIGILGGLEFIQSYGLLHPGLSTRKILLTNKGICKLYDFCLSEDASNTVRIRKSRITCTLNELAPEALLRDKYSKASDVWSVAVVIWQILSCGVLPFPNEEQSPASETAVYKIPETWPTNYKVLRNEHLLKSWSQETSLRPTLSQLKSAFVKNFEALDTYGPSNTSTDDLASSYVHMRGTEKSVDES